MHRNLLYPVSLFVCFSEEGDDDDDPEYNFLDDLDEPDLEDYRNDRAVRITSEFSQAIAPICAFLYKMPYFCNSSQIKVRLLGLRYNNFLSHFACREGS